MSNLLRNSKLIESCTPSIAFDAQVQAASTAFDQEMYEIIDDTGSIVFVPNIMALTDGNLVDILAWQFRVDGYDATADLEFRKSLVQLAIQWHVTKGTVALLQQVLDTYWPGGASVQEWFQYKIPLPPNYPTTGWHDRYKFRIIINQDVITPEEEAAVLDKINRYKPLSRWCETFVHSKPSSGNLYAAGYAQIFKTRSTFAPVRR